MISRKWGPVDRSVGEVGMLKASNKISTVRTNRPSGPKEWGPVDWLVGEARMLKASKWADHSQRGEKKVEQNFVEGTQLKR
jgi:hypothetical protein